MGNFLIVRLLDNQEGLFPMQSVEPYALPGANLKVGYDYISKFRSISKQFWYDIA